MRKKVSAVFVLLSLLLTLSSFATTNIASAKTVSKAQSLSCHSTSVIVFDQNGGRSFSCSGDHWITATDAYEVWNQGWSGWVYGNTYSGYFTASLFCDNSYHQLPDLYGSIDVYLSPTRLAGC